MWFDDDDDDADNDDAYKNKSLNAFDADLLFFSQSTASRQLISN